jgi:protein-S-isoprenylcysteine O-methyltransferase Ste14
MNMQLWNAVVFGAGTAALVYISRNSLSRPRSHGFYRFFAWELILALFLLYVSSWFEDWIAWYQIISWMLLFSSIVPLVLGVRALGRGSKPDTKIRSEPELLNFERTTHLVTDGIYRYIRHPMYSSLFLLDWGIFFKKPSIVGVLLAACASLFLIATARADEAECSATFGPEYRQYMRHTKMFIPYVFLI